MLSEPLSDVSRGGPPALRRAEPTSTNLPLADERTADADIRALFARYRERFGRADLPGILLCFATNPAMLRGMMEIAEGVLFGESLLCRRHKEMLATYVSHQNACAYCTDSHAALLMAQGGSVQLTCALQQGDLDAAQLTHAELALIRFAEKANANAPSITRADVDAAMGAGWTEAELAETVHIAALFAAFNRIANGFGLTSPYPDGVKG